MGDTGSANAKTELRRRAAAHIASRRPGGTTAEIRVSSGTSLFRAGAEVIRVAQPERSAMSSADLVTLADLYSSHGVPVPRPLAPAELTPDGDEVTVWEHVENDPTATFPYRQVGLALRTLHRIPLTAAESALGRLPPYLPEAVSGWISARMPVLTSGSEEFGFAPGEVGSYAADATSEAAAACRGEPQHLLHGDVSRSNVLYGCDDVRLCDFEACVRGPWVWDLVNTRVQVAVGMAPEAGMEELVEAYGLDPTSSRAWGPLCRLRALDIATFHMHEAILGSEAGREAPVWVSWMRAGFPRLPKGRRRS
jgi:aminoglycoside phosphotransferase (APT) family kinase protein